ncbi:MAG: antiporter, family [Candidatus Dependentiae bacterium]|nr:antiporter, family [Candidatus Dependentiae bacterium]
MGAQVFVWHQRGAWRGSCCLGRHEAGGVKRQYEEGAGPASDDALQERLKLFTMKRTGISRSFSVFEDFVVSYSRKNWLLAALFFLIIGTFWLLGSLQEPIFYHLVGRQYHPDVNVISFFCIIPLLLGYMAGLNRWQPQTVLAGATALYALFFAAAAFLLTVPGIGLPDAIPSCGNLLGWAYFAITKTYGSLMVTLFWTYATSVTTVEEAKKSFPFITVCAQIGSVAGTTLVRIASGYGIPLLVAGAVVGMVAIGLVLHVLSCSVSITRVVSQEPSAGIFEGFWLLVRHPYLRGVLVVSTGYLIITAFFDYQMHYLANQLYPTIEQFAWFKGVYGQMVNGVTLVLALGGTGWLLTHVGVAACLLVYPLVTAVCVGIVWCYPTLWVVAAVMVIIRALSLGFNNPTKEIVYIPENEEVRYKAKGWIDIVGYRAAFALGSQITSWIATPYQLLVNASAGISWVIIVVWGYYAWVVGKHFKAKS